MERQPPDDESNLRAQQAHGGDRAALRVVDSDGAVTEPALPELPDAPDLSVDEETATLIERRRYRAVVRAKTEVPIIHTGLRRLLSQRLDGRRPATGFFGDYVEVQFGVMDNRTRSWNEARALGSYLTAALDPRENREAFVGIAFFDTSDLDPLLPEELRTLR